MPLVRALTEDEVRDGYTDSDGFHKGAKQILEFDKPENKVKQGTGQLTTFKQLGFYGKGSNHKPDGWYLPTDTTKVAIILETKSSDKNLNGTAFANELLENVKIASEKTEKDRNIEKGAVKEMGTHDELCRLNGDYVKLWAQFTAQNGA